eukprot:365679-Chlamydomonas_euryale.AAC.9
MLAAASLAQPPLPAPLLCQPKLPAPAAGCCPPPELPPSARSGDAKRSRCRGGERARPAADAGADSAASGGIGTDPLPSSPPHDGTTAVDARRDASPHVAGGAFTHSSLYTVCMPRSTRMSGTRCECPSAASRSRALATRASASSSRRPSWPDSFSCIARAAPALRSWSRSTAMSACRRAITTRRLPSRMSATRRALASAAAAAPAAAPAACTSPADRPSAPLSASISAPCCSSSPTGTSDASGDNGSSRRLPMPTMYVARLSGCARAASSTRRQNSLLAARLAAAWSPSCAAARRAATPSSAARCWPTSADALARMPCRPVHSPCAGDAGSAARLPGPSGASAPSPNICAWSSSSCPRASSPSRSSCDTAPAAPSSISLRSELRDSRAHVHHSRSASALARAASAAPSRVACTAASARSADTVALSASKSASLAR